MVRLKQMRKVINNLLSNAVKHVPSQGRIVMEVGKTDEEAWFSVEDNGSGIQPADIDKRFSTVFIKVQWIQRLMQERVLDWL